MKIEFGLSVAAIAALGLSGAALAHDDKMDHGAAHEHAAALAEKAFGRPGDPKKAVRVIEIEMSDALRFTPAEVSIRKGETVRFRVKNSGKLAHEMVLGTMDELKEHAKIMQAHPGMEHDEAHQAHVQAGRTRSLTWQFTRAGDFYYGCLVPGHLEGGMVGKIVVR